MEKNDKNQILSKVSGVAVLVVGDIMLDRFVYGHVERISPESPVPVLSIRRDNMMLGGAGNALANLAGLGAKSAIVSVVGDDVDGEIIAQQIASLGSDASGLLKDSQRPTTLKTRFLAGHQQLLRTDFESKEPVSEETKKRFLEAVQAHLNDVQAVIISDYGKGLLCPETLAAIIGMAQKVGVPVVVDPKGQDFSIYRGATTITPNKKELSDATRGRTVETDADVIAAANQIIEECGIECVIATRSADGISVIHKDQDPFHVRSRDIEVFDVSGAGDTVIATIAAILAAGGTFAEAATIANMAGSIVVTKVGTAPIRMGELENQIMDGNTDRTRRAGICSWEEAAEQVCRWRASGLKVGFTNGCFDILHHGHVSYLNDAKDHCDRLIVGLNTDASVQILKGTDRPVHHQDSRASVLGALGSTDMIVFFGAQKAGDDNTANDLLSVIQPDIYFKGGDYKVDDIPETPTVRSYGGEVHIMPVQEGHSTTASIEKARKSA